MNQFWQDLRYGTRLMAKHLSFALLAVLTLALGTIDDSYLQHGRRGAVAPAPVATG